MSFQFFQSAAAKRASQRQKARALETSNSDLEVLNTQIEKHEARVVRCTQILRVSWVTSAYWTASGLIQTADEYGGADFIGTMQAVLAAIVAAVVVAGACSMLLAFAGEEGGA